MKLTPSQVKNCMRRGLRLIVDPEPKQVEKQRCFEFFNHACAYCGIEIEMKRGDFDHLVPAACGGRNHISNRVFSCKPCNAKEKRDKPWEQFLIEKHGVGSVLEAKKQKIMQWISSTGAASPLPEKALQLLESEAARVIDEYDQACKKIRGIQEGF